ncbi:MAG TPA: FliH/SctL family protein [Angustibacter sp.]|nr:FliH/SctL family protein [Angustibacter sp.]
MTSSANARQFAPLSASGTLDVRDERQAARALGYAEGWSSGSRAAAAQAEAVQEALVQEHERAAAAARLAVSNAISGLDRASSQLLQSVAPTLDDATDAVLDAALALARVIVGAELTVVDASARAALRRALRPLPTDSVVTVRLNASDVAVLDDVLTRTPTGDLFEGHQVRLVADPSVRPGDAVAEQAGSVVDATIEAAFTRAVEVLRGGGAAS